MQRDCAIQNLLSIRVTAQAQITVCKLCKEKRVLRIEFDSALEIFGGFRPPALSSIDKT